MKDYHTYGGGPTRARHGDEVGVVMRDSRGRYTVALDAVASALLSHRGQ